MADPNKIFFSAGTLNHREISNAPGDYTWNMPQAIITLPDPLKVYYIYAKCSKTDSTATWEATELMLRYDKDANFYYFRIGVVYEVVDGVRGEAFDYGKTWINGRFITTGQIQSALGEAGSYWNLDTNILHIGGGASGLENLTEWPAKQSLIDANSNYITAVLPGTLAAMQSQIDGSVDSWFNAYVPTTTNEPALSWNTPALKQAHANDTFTNTATDGGSWRWILIDTVWQWRAITDSVAVQALALAGLAKDTADGKRRVFVTTPTDAMAYDVGDMWVNATNGAYVNDLLTCNTAKVAGAVFSITHWHKASKYTDDTTALAAASSAANTLVYAQGKINIGGAVYDINGDNLTTTINGGRITTGTIVSLGKVSSFNGLHLVDQALVAGNPTDPYVFGATFAGADSAYPILYVGRRRSTVPNATTDGGFIVARDTLDGKYKMHVGNNTSFINWDGSAMTISGALLANAQAKDDQGVAVNLFEIVNGVIVFKLPLSSTGEITAWSTYGATPTIFEALGGYVDGVTVGYINGKLTVIGGGSVDVNVANLTNYYTKTVADGRYALLGHIHPISAITGLQVALDGKLAVGDISLWAKAVVKPAYVYSEIGGTPALNYLPLTGGTLTGALNVNAGVASSLYYTAIIGPRASADGIASLWFAGAGGVTNYAGINHFSSDGRFTLFNGTNIITLNKDAGTTFAGSVTAPLLKLNTAGAQLQTLDVLTGISIQSTNNLTSTYLDFLGNQGNGWATYFGRGYRFEYNPSDSSFNLWQRAAQEGGAIKSVLNFNSTGNATFAGSVVATGLQVNGVASFGNDVWHTSVEGYERFYFGYGSATYIKGDGVYIRNNSNANLLSLSNTGAATFSNVVTALGGNSTEWNTAFSKTVPFTITPTKVTIDRDLEVTGNITASKDVIAYVAGAVTSDVLSGLTGVAPLWKPTASTVGIKLDASQFQINAANELQIKAGTVQPAGSYEVPLTFSTGLTRTGNVITNNITQYTHPANHLPSIIAQDASNRFVTDAEKGIWNTKQAAGDYATITFVNSSIATLTNLAPDVLNTFAELASAMGGDPNFSTTVLNQIATKINAADVQSWAKVGGTVPTWNQSTTGNAATATNASQLLGRSDYYHAGNLNLSTVPFSASTGTFSNTLTINKTVGSVDNGNSGYSLFLDTGNGNISANVIRFTGAISVGLYFGRAINEDSFIWGTTAGEQLLKLTRAGAGTFSGSVTAPSIIAPLYAIRNASGVLQWTVSVGAAERLEFKNASGVTEMVLTQAGEIHAKTEITAYSSII